ncbi:MAG: acetyl-CoA hydrolase/transferase C-terminal domain-containing protein [Pseudomonadota bacterium]
MTPIEAFTQLRADMPEKARLYVAGCSGEPLALVEGLRESLDLARGVTFTGIWIPGVNTTDWAGLHEEAQAETIFLSPALRPSFDAGRTHFLPLSYTQSVKHLSQTPLDGAVVMVSPPDQNGQVSLGVSADFSNEILDRTDIPVMALINQAMPAPKDGPLFPLSRFQYVSETDTPLVEVQTANLPETFTAIGWHITSLIEPGDTLQFGLGNVQQAVLEALTKHRDLKIHAGMISDPLLGLLDKGCIADASGAITTGVAIGTNALYERAAHDPRIAFRPVRHTHAITTLAAIPNFKAINSCIEVDLFGQANAEFIGGKQVSGTGGLVDFLRGGEASEGGRAIVALTSKARKGTISRIVPRLPADATSIARADVGTVVTEHGIADLRGKTIDQRALALIAIAAPEFRDSLSNAWDDIRRAL